MLFSYSFFSVLFFKIEQPYNITYTAIAWENSCCILPGRSDFYIVVKLLVAVHALSMRMSTSLLVDEILLSMNMNLSTDIRAQPFIEEMALY